MGARHKELLRTWRDELRTSFWPVPMAMGAAALGIAAGAPVIDGWLGAGPDESQPFFVYVSTPDEARSLLSTLLSSMMTMTSLVFSITMVVLTLAASQFGPRLIRSFMGSLRTQVVLGTFVMTIVYCLLLISIIGWREGEGPFAYLSVSVAIALALVSVAFLVLFIHDLGRSIMSETLIERVAEELDGLLLHDLSDFGSYQDDAPEAVLPDDFESRARLFGPARAGYVQAIDFDEIAEAARRADVLVGLFFRPGDYVAEGGRTIGVHPPERHTPELAAAVDGAIVVGVHRTPVQDVEFAIRHLVEIAVRALSPGINDPYTAISVVNRLSASMARLMSRSLPRGVFADDDGMARVVCPRPTYATILGAAFNQIRQNGGDKPVVLIHLIEAYSRIAPHARSRDQLAALEDGLGLLVATAERRVGDPHDLATVTDRAADARNELARCRARHDDPAPPGPGGG